MFTEEQQNEITKQISEAVEAAVKPFNDALELLKKEVDAAKKTTEKLSAACDKSFKAIGKELKKSAGEAPVAEEPKPKEKVELKVPDAVITVNDSLKVQFTKPSFIFNKTVYISEAEVENKELITTLVKNQTHNTRGFKDGLLKRVE